MNDKTIAEPQTDIKMYFCNYAYIIMVIYRPTMQGIGQTQSSLIVNKLYKRLHRSEIYMQKRCKPVNVV